MASRLFYPSSSFLAKCKFRLRLLQLKFLYRRNQFRILRLEAVYLANTLLSVGIYRLRVARLEAVYLLRMLCLQSKYRLSQFKLSCLKRKHKFLCSGIIRELIETVDEIRKRLKFPEIKLPRHK